MKKILFVLAIYVPSFAMNTVNYGTSLEDDVRNIKVILYDQKDSETGKVTHGLQTKVTNIENILYDQKDLQNTTIPGLDSRVGDNTTRINTLENTTIPGLDLRVGDNTTRINTLENTTIPGLDSRIGNNTTRINTLENTTIPGLDSRVGNNTTRINTLENTTIPGLDSRVGDNTTRINTLENTTIPGLESKVDTNTTSVSKLEKIIYDKIDSNTGEVTLGLKSLVETNIPLIKPLQDSVDSMSLGISALTAGISGLPQMIEGINKKINDGWDTFLEEKFKKYMEVKNQVLDIIANCKINGQDTPTYIVETAEQLMAMKLDMRRLTLSRVLTKLKVFEQLLDDDELQSIQTYLDNTNVPEPDLKSLQEIMPNFVIEGEYLKVYGETRKFTRSAGFKTGLPKEGWMDQSCDYFAYGLRPTLERAISQENSKRSKINDEIKLQNAEAQARYDAGIISAERVDFPTDNFTNLVTEYNRLLVRHEI